MGARGFARESAASQLYDVLEPYKIGSGVLHSVFADSQDSWLFLNTSSNNSLSLRAEANDDTLWLMDGPRRELGLDVSASETWADYIDKEITYGWLAMNQNGYIDAALLGFGSAIPDICICVIASGIKVSRIGSWQRASFR